VILTWLVIKMENLQEKSENLYYIEAIVAVLLKTLIPLALLVGGLFLLFLNLAGWSIIFGIPMVVIGVVFLIYTYDELVTKRIHDGKQLPSEEDEY
jgi:drug/metabolite transporter (DMT)-like permease